jgi:hypothetical protein
MGLFPEYVVRPGAIHDPVSRNFAEPFNKALSTRYPGDRGDVVHTATSNPAGPPINIKRSLAVSCPQRTSAFQHGATGTSWNQLLRE